MLVKFEVYNDGVYWCARGIGENIFTQGKTLDELTDNMKEAVEVYYMELLEKGEQIKILSLFELEVEPSAKATSS
ncbi:MAG: type II toxin-antitoxin system HicB family antitoxin [Candidatus Methanofastidiosia archaeon]